MLTISIFYLTFRVWEEENARKTLVVGVLCVSLSCCLLFAVFCYCDRELRVEFVAGGMSEMMEEILGLDARKLLPGSLILIEDSVAAKGAFLLNYFLKKLLAAPHASEDEAGGGTTRVLFLALSEPFSHYNRISRKQVIFQRD